MGTAPTIKLPTGGGTVFLLPWGEIPEAELLARACLTRPDRERYAGFNPSQEGRRKEWLAARVLAREELGGRIDYEPSGRPILLSPAGVASRRHISISHTTGWAAMMISSGGPCGVDIEPADRPADRVAARIGTPEELSLASTVLPDNPALALWCAKEAAYKAFGNAGTDFREHIRLRSVAARTLIIAVKANRITLEIFTMGNILGACGSGF